MKKPVAFSIALGLFALANVAVASYSHLYQPTVQHVAFRWNEEDPRTKPWSWWLARRWLQQKQAPDVVLFGSSQMGSAMVASDAKHLVEAIDSLTHRRAATLEDDMTGLMGRKINAFSLASPGAMCSDAYMASSALFTPDKKPKVVVIGLSPRDFIDNTMPYPAATEPYKFYSQFVAPGKLTPHTYDGAFAWLQYANESLPFRKLGSFIQANLSSGSDSDAPKSANAKTALAAIMGGGEAQPGKWLVPCVIPPMWTDNSKEYKVRFKNPHPHVFAAEKAYFSEFLAKMQSEGIAVLVVGMPSLPMNRALLPDSFWTEFRSMIATQTKEHGAEWLDLSDDPSFVKADFLDTVHLNAEGGEKLFAKFASTIKDRSTLCASLNANRSIATQGGTQ